MMEGLFREVDGLVPRELELLRRYVEGRIQRLRSSPEEVERDSPRKPEAITFRDPSGYLRLGRIVSDVGDRLRVRSQGDIYEIHVDAAISE